MESINVGANRIYAQVVRSGDCLLWTGAVRGRGYGVITLSYPRTQWYVHRLMWTYHWGPIPPGLIVMHSCDTPACVEITHLSVGTHRDNALDKVAKGRAPTHGVPNGTTCRNGLHPWTAENIRECPDGKRRCRLCMHEKYLRRQARNRSLGRGTAMTNEAEQGAQV